MTIRATLFTINFIVAVMLAISCVISVAAPESPYQFLAGFALAVPFSVYAVCEWLVFYRKRLTLCRKLAIVNLIFTVLIGLSLFSCAGEFLISDGPLNILGFLVFASLALVVTGYLAFMTWNRFPCSQTE